MKRILCVLAFLAILPVVAQAVTTDATTPGVIVPGRSDLPIVFSWNLPDDYCVGLGFDGNYFWVGAGNFASGQCTFFIYDEYGTLITSVPQDAGAGSSGWGNRDLEWNGTYMFGSYSNRINGFNASYVYQGYFNGPLNPNRAQGFDGTYYYTGGFGYNVYRLTWDGVWSSTAASQTLGGPYDGTYGLTYDSVLNELWMSTADATGTIYELDMDANAIQMYTTLPEYDTHGGCTMANTRFGYILAVLAQAAPDQVFFLDLGHGQTATQESTWGGVKALYR